MASLYDSADIYDLIESQERYDAYKKHWESVLENKKVNTMLDVSIGTGSVTLPVTELGISLSGSDLSETMLTKCKQKATDKDLSVDLKVSDFRELQCWQGNKYDMVASTGNSLAYVSNEEVLKTLEQMDSLVADDGYLYFDLRNWDKILKERNRFFLYNPFFVDETRINLVQVWDYNDDESMTFNLLYTFEKDNKIFRKEKFEERYNPVSRSLLIEKLKDLGYGEIQVGCFPFNFKTDEIDMLDWYTVVAHKGNA